MQSISEFFEKDHNRIDDLYSNYKLLTTSDQNKAKDIFSELSSNLQKHILWEEKILFPLFEDKTGMHNAGPTIVMRMEHKEIKDYLSQILNNLNNGNFQNDDLENRLIEVLSMHNHKEENVLYPMIDRLITEKERDEVFLKIKEL